MHKFIAMSDLHLNFNINPGVKRKFLNNIKKAGCPIVITGDIGDGRSLLRNLCELAEVCKDTTVYFITGNHDYYHSSFQRTTDIIHQAVKENPNLVYLTDHSPVELDEETCLIGADSWYDCKILPAGEYYHLVMNDFNYIEDIRFSLGREAIIENFTSRADNALKAMVAAAKSAIQKYKNIILTSHPLPFGCMNKTKGSEFSHFYVWYDAGKFISDFAQEHKDKRFLWLCGHTHFRGEWHNDNLDVYSLGSEYYFPRVDACVENMSFKYVDK